MRTQIHTIQRNCLRRTGLFAAVAVLGLALSACGSDQGVAGSEPVDGSIGGGTDTAIGTDDARTDGDSECGGLGLCDVHVPGDTYENDGWNPGDAWNPWDGFTPDVGPVQCVSDNNCPSSPCSKGVCDQNSHQCVAYLAPDYSFCPGMGGACGVDGYCQAGKCTTKGMICDDGNPCTQDVCDPASGCVYQPILGCGGGCKSDSQCNDGNACTTDMCYSGQCSYGGIACASSDPCTIVACDPKSGMCVAKPIPGCGGNGCKADFQCDDGNFCTIDACAIDATGTGKCIHKVDPTQIGMCCDPAASSIPPCNDGDACTQDLCGADYMCQFIPTPGCVNKCKADSDCAAGDVCTIAKCDVASGVCLYGTIPNCCNPAYCDDGNPCTKDGCDAATGGCNWTPIPGCTKPCDPVACNDYNPCTSDGCDSVGNCVYKVIPNCTAQFCKSDMECQDADKCTQDMCDMASYTCQHYQIPGCGMLMCMTNADCNDFDNCTGDLCLNGSCAHKGVTCDDGNPCTADQCLAVTGGCSNAPIPGCTATQCKTDAMCDDKNFCSVDTCVTGWCNHLFIPGCFPPP